MAQIAEEGEKFVFMSGERFVLSPLTLAQAKRARPLLAILASGSEEADDAAADFISMGLIRRHPDMTPEKVAEMIELPQLEATIRTILTISGMAPEGEAMAGTSQSQT